MRIWSLHPRYLDTKGLGGVWVETLLAKAVFEGKTKGYTHHPQLNRFRETSDPVKYVSTYLQVIHDEATKRGFKYNFSKVGEVLENPKPITVTKGQLEYELSHLRNKLQKRSPDRYAVVSDITLPDIHPLFEVVEGSIESWEILETPQTKQKSKKTKKKASESEEVDVEIPSEVQEKSKRSRKNIEPVADVKKAPEIKGKGKKNKANAVSTTEMNKLPEIERKKKRSSTTELKKTNEVKGKSRKRTLVTESEMKKGVEQIHEVTRKKKKQDVKVEPVTVDVQVGENPASDKKLVCGKKTVADKNTKNAGHVEGNKSVNSFGRRPRK